MLLNGYHGNDNCYNNFEFSFGYVFPSSMTVQIVITIKWKEKKLSMIKIFKVFVFDQRNCGFSSTYLSYCKEFEIVLQSAFKLHPNKIIIENKSPVGIQPRCLT